MRITSDWHIHSRNSCDFACMVVSDLIDEAHGRGVVDFGLTDHLHTPYNLPDIAASRAEYLAGEPSERFHFGIEVSCVSQWELDQIATGAHESPTYGLRTGGPPGAAPAIALSAEDVETYGIEYVVGGTHWPLYVPYERDAIIRDYHRQNMFLATHPLIDVVAHPWWWMGHWQDDDGRYTGAPWLDDFGAVPRSMHDEFCAACIEHGTVVEINLQAMLLNGLYPERFKRQYVDYMADLGSRGVRLGIGSDCHSPHYTTDFEAAADILDGAGLREEDMWRLAPRERPTRDACTSEKE